MENKKAIILDMDETLETSIKNEYGIDEMILRSNLDELIVKLNEAKTQGIDVILCTTAKDEWVEKFLQLKPEFRKIFNKKYTRDNEKIWKNYSKEMYPLEYKAKMENANIEYLKPVTTFGYDIVLYIDNNKLEEFRLHVLFEITQDKLEKDVSYFSSFGFYGSRIPYNTMIRYREIAAKSNEFAQNLKEYLKIEENYLGCHMMCLEIDNFINKKFVAGLTLRDNEHYEQYAKYNEELDLLLKSLEELSLMKK